MGIFATQTASDGKPASGAPEASEALVCLWWIVLACLEGIIEHIPLVEPRMKSRLAHRLDVALTLPGSVIAHHAPP